MADHEEPRISALAPAPPPDIDRILQAIREEARARGSRTGVGDYPVEPAAGGASADSHGVSQPDMLHVADFLPLPLDAFINIGYREVLGRNADAVGAAHYQRALLRGRLTRIEVLGRMALSPEGRAMGRHVKGLTLAFILATTYRLPLAGPLAALLARVLRLPAHLQDRSMLEVAAVASGSWMKR